MFWRKRQEIADTTPLSEWGSHSGHEQWEYVIGYVRGEWADVPRSHHRDIALLMTMEIDRIRTENTLPPSTCLFLVATLATTRIMGMLRRLEERDR